MYKILALLAIAAAAFGAAAEDVTGTVKATNLNVRVLPGTSYSVVATLKKGETVTVLAKKDKWIKIKAPKSSSVWISISAVKDGEVAKETKLRSGPGISYNDFGTIKKGMKVKLLEEKRGEWSRIEVPDELTAWTAADYVDIPQAASLKTEDVALPEPPKKTEDAKPDEKETKDKATKDAKDTTADTKTAKDAKDTKSNGNSKDPLPFEGKAKDVTIEGVVVGISGAVYVTHAFAVQKKNEYVPAFYIHYKKSLKSYENKLVKIRGMQRKVKGWTLPMIEVNSISPVE